MGKTFKPDKAMIYYWIAYSMPDVKPEVTDAAKRAIELMKQDGVTEIDNWETLRQYTYRWDKIEGYREWRDKFWDELMRDGQQFLDKVGIMKSVKDFRYWEAMQMKYANFRRKEDVTSDNEKIDTVVVKFIESKDGISDGSNESSQGNDTEGAEV